MAALTLFPLQFQRQDAVPVDIDMVFSSTSARNSYLTSPRRYAGQMVSDTQLGQCFVLNAARDTWLPIGASTPSVIPFNQASVTMAIGHANNIIQFNFATSQTYTVTEPGGGPFMDIGTTIVLSWSGVGAVSIVQGANATVQTPETLNLKKRYAKVTLTKMAALYWEVEGNLQPA